MTQGYPVSLTIINIVVDAVVTAVPMEVCGPQEAHSGFVWAVGNHNIVFCVEDF